MKPSKSKQKAPKNDKAKRNHKKGTDNKESSMSLGQIPKKSFMRKTIIAKVAPKTGGKIQGKTEKIRLSVTFARHGHAQTVSQRILMQM